MWWGAFQRVGQIYIDGTIWSDFSFERALDSENGVSIILGKENADTTAVNLGDWCYVIQFELQIKIIFKYLLRK